MLAQDGRGRQDKKETKVQMILLIDANFIGHTVRHTMGDLSYHDVPTGVVFGFLSRVLALGFQFQTNNMIFAWDSPISKRKKMDAGYKAQRRQKMDEEELEALYAAFKQFDALHKRLLPSMGFANSFKVKGYEADDIMAQIAARARHVGKRAMMVTADNDMYQCLAPGVAMYNPTTKTKTTAKEFVNTRGITPREWAMVKAIAGCPSDNVIGVPRVGEKTAIRQLKEELDPLSCAAKSIQTCWDVIVANKALVTLPFPGLPLLRLRKNQFSKHGLVSVCKEYGLKRAMAQGDKWAQFFEGDFFPSAHQHRKRKA